MKKYSLGFTFVELIVTTTIVAILATIGFYSYTNQLSSSRDSRRITEITDINNALSAQLIKSTKVALPSKYVQVTTTNALQTNLSSALLVGYQGEVDAEMLKQLGITQGGMDPKDKFPYVYYVAKDRRSTQMMAYLEDTSSIASLFITQAEAGLSDYSRRGIKLVGKPLGIILENATKRSIHDITSIATLGYFNIVTTGANYSVYLTDTSKITGASANLVDTLPNKSCKRIRDVGGSVGDGVYRINPNGVGEIQVYCDMSTEGGGWTLVHKTTANVNNLSGTLDTTEGVPKWDGDTEYRLSINYWKNISTEKVMARNFRIDGRQWDDISSLTINTISTAGVALSGSDPYNIFNGSSAQNNCTDGTNYWNSGCCTRCVNFNDKASYGSFHQPMLYSLSTSYTGSAIEGAGGSGDSGRHVLSKMGLFIR